MLTTTLSSLGKERMKAERELEVWRKQRDLGTRYRNEIKTQTGESKNHSNSRVSLLPTSFFINMCYYLLFGQQGRESG